MLSSHLCLFFFLIPTFFFSFACAFVFALPCLALPFAAVYRITPRNYTGLTNLDSGNSRGDVFFGIYEVSVCDCIRTDAELVFALCGSGRRGGVRANTSLSADAFVLKNARLPC